LSLMLLFLKFIEVKSIKWILSNFLMLKT
jgi:hypothetical protein